MYSLMELHTEFSVFYEKFYRFRVNSGLAWITIRFAFINLALTFFPYHRYFFLKQLHNKNITLYLQPKKRNSNKEKLIRNKNAIEF